MKRVPTSNPRGRNLADTFQRDVGIAVLVEWTAQCFGLAATRNPASKRPSAAYLVAIALRRKGIPLGERRVNAIYSAAHSWRSRSASARRG